MLAQDELAMARAAGMNDVVDELHAMEAGMRRAFGAEGDPLIDEEYDPSNPNRSWAVHRFRVDELRGVGGGRAVYTTSRPPGEHGR